jgi:hypothetical protein
MLGCWLFKGTEEWRAGLQIFAVTTETSQRLSSSPLPVRYTNDRYTVILFARFIDIPILEQSLRTSDLRILS